jgi:tRNA threonylcarbamoyladenosine biosynthesis protein TsaE
MSVSFQGERAAVYLSASPEETRALGETLGNYVCAGDLIALIGELGAGKTLFVGGLALGLGVDPAAYVSSPTFTIMHRYLGRFPLYHIDLYRIETPEAFLALGLEEYLEGDGVAAVEWADHGCGLLPKDRLTVRLRYTGLDTRAIEFVAAGDRYLKLVRELLCDVAAGPRFLA